MIPYSVLTLANISQEKQIKRIRIGNTHRGFNCLYQKMKRKILSLIREQDDWIKHQYAKLNCIFRLKKHLE